MKRGVIFVGGLIGTGKTSLAKGLAKKLSLPYVDVDEIKKEVYPTDPAYEYNLKHNIPFSDETRKKVFKRVVDVMAGLAQEHDLIIIDETLHKKAMRQILFDGALKYFENYLIVWVKADEDIIRQRLETKARDGHILKNAFGMYLSLKKEFEEFEEPDLVFENNHELDVSIIEFTKRVKERLI